MSLTGYIDFADAIYESIELLLHTGKLVDSGHWQGVTTQGKPDLQTLEMLNLGWQTDMPHSLSELQHQIKPNLPWADLHFGERVSRDPTNPGEAYKDWPWWQGGFQEAKSMAPDQTSSGEFKFTHTYQERFWPFKATPYSMEPRLRGTRKGIRYDYGTLDDVVSLLLRSPNTRQAYLPIFFPEDTGAVHGGRIPCTLGYHFLLRDGHLHLWYDIRSCDAVRHFRDDLYLAARLLLWVLKECDRRAQEALTDDAPDSNYMSPWLTATPGRFTFLAHSFHVHRGDLHLLHA